MIWVGCALPRSLDLDRAGFVELVPGAVVINEGHESAPFARQANAECFRDDDCRRTSGKPFENARTNPGRRLMKHRFSCVEAGPEAGVRKSVDPACRAELGEVDLLRAEEVDHDGVRQFDDRGAGRRV